MTQSIEQQFLQAMSQTATNRNYPAHMDLISRKVQVHGVPGFEVIGYDDWASQCRHEFEQGIIHSVSYQGMKVITRMPRHVMFKTVETVIASDGSQNTMGVEMLIEQEDDGKWRVTQERVLPRDELEHDIANGLLDGQ